VSRALDTSKVVLPGLPTSRLLARLLGMALLSFCGAMLAGYASFGMLFLLEPSWRVPLITCWDNAAVGMFFWPFVIAGTIWSWCWCVGRLWNRRWVLAGTWVIAVTVPAVALLTPVQALGAPFLGWAIIAGMCVQLGRSKWTERR
jgi:hypothetical protein